MRNLFRSSFTRINQVKLRSSSHYNLQVKPTSNYLSIRSSHGCLYGPLNALPLISFYPGPRYFSSDQVRVDVQPPNSINLVDIFSNTSSDEEIKKHLELLNVTITHDLTLNVLKELKSKPNLAWKIFNWVLKNGDECLSSEVFNFMLDIFLSSGFVEKFWYLVKIMRRKGYVISRSVYARASEKFEKEGNPRYLEKLKGLHVDDSSGNVCFKICKLIKGEIGGDDFERLLRDMNVTFSSSLVKRVIRSLASEPVKAFLFFKWIEESGLFHHDAGCYNAVASILTRECCIEMLLNAVEEMKRMEYELSVETYRKISAWFSKNKLLKEAVDLYEFAMSGSSKPLEKDCVFLLKKIVVREELDMDLLSRVVNIYVQNGNGLSNLMLNEVRKLLSCVDRLGECGKVLKVMKDNGLADDTSIVSKVAYKLSKSGKVGEITEFMNVIEETGCNSKRTAWISFVQGHCAAGHLDKAKECIENMLESDKSAAGSALDFVVAAYCNKELVSEACQILNELVEKGLKPNYGTFKRLVSGVLARGRFEEGLKVLGSMKNHGFPPYTDPFIAYVSDSGTCEEAIAFLNAAKGRRVRSSPIYLRTFEAYLSAAKQNEAQNLLSRCPCFVRNNVDILELFASFGSNGEKSSSAVSV